VTRDTVLVAAVSLLVLAAFATGFTQETFTPSRDPVRGAHLFATKGCAECHARGNRGGPGAPDLAKMARPLILYDVAARMWNHIPAMAQRITAQRADRPYLNADELSDVLAYLASLDASGRPGHAAGEPVVIGEAGDRQRGERVVAAKGCLECHALAGGDLRGKIGGNFSRWGGFDSPWIAVSAMWNHAFLMEIEARRHQRAWPRLSRAEMADLAAFLARR
jgi:mono/diheme cytochrome c family protein